MRIMRNELNSAGERDEIDDAEEIGIQPARDCSRGTPTDLVYAYRRNIMRVGDH